MGNAFLYGSSGNSTKSLVDGIIIKTYASEEEIPETAEENTIAIVTSVPMKYYKFTRAIRASTRSIGDSRQKIGIVYILVGHHSPAYLEIKNGNNSITIYPIAVYQETAVSGSGNLANVIPIKRRAKVYRNGQWHEFSKSIYSPGNKYESITGGWMQVTDTSNNGKVSWGEDYLFLGCDDTKDSYASIYTVNPISIYEMTRLRVVFSELTHTGDIGIKIGICKTPYTGTSFDSLNDDIFVKYVEFKEVIDGTVMPSDVNYVDIDIGNLIQNSQNNNAQMPGNVKDLYHVQLAIKKTNATITGIYFHVDYDGDSVYEVI